MTPSLLRLDPVSSKRSLLALPVMHGITHEAPADFEGGSVFRSGFSRTATLKWS
jgi:hypothetical protein